MVHLTVGCGGCYVCTIVCQFIGWGLLLGFSDFWLGDMFGIGFVCLFVGGYVMTCLSTLGMV